jgi:hypothetical protein
MNGFAIVKIEADSAAANENILQHFNAYLQQSAKTPSFIESSAGYFRIAYDDRIGASSAAVAKFGTFLQTSGYSISGISGATAVEGENGTLVSFGREGSEARVVLSTLNVY